MINPLSQRRNAIESRWADFTSGTKKLAVGDIGEEIVSSWERSSTLLNREATEIPVDDQLLLDAGWHSSPLIQAIEKERYTLQQLAREGELVAAVADPAGRLLWTAPSTHMKGRAESVRFVRGGCWSESSAGTNAVGLSLKLRRPVTVFSSEHFLPEVQDWVCYAAPIIHPQSGQCMGTLDMSTTWKRHSPLGQVAVTGLARSISNALPEEVPRAELELHLLGTPRIFYCGKQFHLPLRQIEILSLLVLNPRGLSLEALHAALYGDNGVSTSTLKAELSHLRKALGGQIGSRPYRLEMSVWCDVTTLWESLRQQEKDCALQLYRGSFLVQSVSPEIEEWRRCIDAVMQRVLERCDDPSELLEKLCQDALSSDLVRDRLTEYFQ